MSMLLDKRMELRLSKSEKVALEQAARSAGMNASQYVRYLIRTNGSPLSKAS